MHLEMILVYWKTFKIYLMLGIEIAKLIVELAPVQAFKQ